MVSEFEISEKDWNYIVENLEANNFWTYSTTGKREGLHGTTWILEGYKPIKDRCTLKNYHRIGRWSPHDSTFLNMCRLFDKLGR